MVKTVISDFTSRRLVFDKGQKSMAVVWSMISGLWIVSGVLKHGVEETVLCLALILPLLLSGFFHQIYPTALSRAMYLVPLNKEEKFEYLRCCYRVKLFGVNGLHLVINLMAVLWGKILWWDGIGMVASFFLLSFPMGDPNNKKYINYEIKLFHTTNSEWNTWKEMLYLVAGVFSYSFWLIKCCGELEEWMYLVVDISFFLQLLLMPWMVKNLKDKFASARKEISVYENRN